MSNGAGPAKYHVSITALFRAGTRKRPGSLTCRNPGAMLWARGELNSRRPTCMQVHPSALTGRLSRSGATHGTRDAHPHTPNYLTGSITPGITATLRWQARGGHTSTSPPSG